MRQQPAITTTITKAGRIAPLVLALLLASLAAVTASDVAFAQGGGLSLVNHDRDFVERRKGGDFVARPVFDQQVAAIHYGIRHPETGDWITSMFRVHGGGKDLGDGWEYSWRYPVLPQQPELPPEEPFLLVMAVSDGADVHTFHAVIPVYRSSSLWDRILAALDPGRWARAFAEWVVEGIYSALCSVVERLSGADACGGSSTP